MRADDDSSTITLGQCRRASRMTSMALSNPLARFSFKMVDIIALACRNRSRPKRGAMMAYEACILLAKIACAGIGYPTGRNCRLKKYRGDAATHRPIAI